MRQRLALAGALLGDPQVLLLDEPSNGLDPDGIRWLRDELRGFADQGGTVFVSSHLIGELSMFADDLVVVGGGRLLAAEPLAAITARGETSVVVQTPQPDELVSLLAARHLAVDADGTRLVVRGSTKAAVSQIAFDHGSRRDDLRAVPTVLRSEWIKVSSLRMSKVILGLTLVINGLASWATATFVTDEVLTAAEVFIYPAVLTSVLAAIASILVFTSEAQHGTLAATLTARPARWLITLGKTATAVGLGLVLGSVGMAAGFAGALAGGVELGDTASMPSTAAWTLLFTSLAAVIGLGVGMTVRHSAGAVSGFLVWWFVAENLILAFAPPTLVHFLPFEAGYRILEVGSDFDSPEILAAALTRPQYALIFVGYAVASLAVGTTLLYRRDTN
jgi:hypothetical protein